MLWDRDINRVVIARPVKFELQLLELLKMNTEYMAMWHKSRQGCGWIFAIVGGLLACFGVYIKVGFIAEVAPSLTVKEYLINFLAVILYGPALPLGILFLFIGIW